MRGTATLLGKRNWVHEGVPVVKAGPVIELTRSAIPPQKPISGLVLSMLSLVGFVFLDALRCSSLSLEAMLWS